ncbi:hypothetical protein EVAR_4197_1 [Eumeta japonica]|uniref:Uncharacterized protein n=1 Tax=Eumeta variegata TaxID=151549 RepID=A0A4C1TG35_EUMVA|nr:hypothetical protein EVAR_4197_1 [Eumeta japonica]
MISTSGAAAGAIVGVVHQAGRGHFTTPLRPLRWLGAGHRDTRQPPFDVSFQKTHQRILINGITKFPFCPWGDNTAVIIRYSHMHVDLHSPEALQRAASLGRVGRTECRKVLAGRARDM